MVTLMRTSRALPVSLFCGLGYLYTSELITTTRLLTLNILSEFLLLVSLTKTNSVRIEATQSFTSFPSDTLMSVSSQVPVNGYNHWHHRHPQPEAEDETFSDCIQGSMIYYTMIPLPATEVLSLPHFMIARSSVVSTTGTKPPAAAVAKH